MDDVVALGNWAGQDWMAKAACAGKTRLFFAPLAGMIPAYATAGALIYVAMLMMSGLANIDWKDHTDTIPAIVTVVMMPLTFSIANGIALGFLTYATLKLLTGQRDKVSISLYVLCVIFIAKFAFL